ncbi:class V chitinase Chi100 [Trichoderma barbatum]
MRCPNLGFAVSLAAVWTLSARVNAAADALDAANAYLSSLPTDLASARAAILAGNYTSRLHHETRSRCPASCSSAGLNSSAWYFYHNIDRLKGCNETMLLDFALFNYINDTKPHVSNSACTADLQSSASENAKSADSCTLKNVKQVKRESSVQLASSGSSSSTHVTDVVAALDQLKAFSTLASSGCDETIKYAYSGDSVVGVYVGSGLTEQAVLTSVLDSLEAHVKSDGSVSENLLAQICSNSSARYSLGVFVNTKGQFGSVQQSLQTWKNSSCITTMEKTTSEWQRVAFLATSFSHSNSATHNTTAASKSKAAISRDTTCRTIQVQSGDSCASLATECGISAADFTKYNPGSTFCGGLVPGQHVCCSAGTLPDFSPKPDSKGNCYSYLVKTGDSCSSLAAAYDIASNNAIESYNKKTWGWNGCQKLFADYTICLSTGYPPMPAPVANSVCGPQVGGTSPPPPGSDLSTLNECPLNACCNIWGQCGTTDDFCVPSNSSTGAPGTAAPGKNGCISNCDSDIISSGAPTEIYSIAYFEAFDWQRPCLHMAVSDIDSSTYSHIHFSFITLNKDFSINVTGVADQLPLLQGMIGIKRVVSIGGWDFSTNPSTYTIFREAVSSEANRQTLVNNVIKFLNDYELDGVDWDWEYPNEPDIPGIPKGSEDETTGYFLLLDELKLKMPADKTALSLVVDYIVYMTYDLHGQWDYINKYASPGCGSYDQGLGNCLRSHVNLTETTNALSMITKAGVPSNMVAVGVSSYGRSFKMSTPGCWGSQCTYTGPNSGAYPGPCTNTSGYMSNYEIGLIASQNPTAQRYWDEDSYSNIVVFNSTEWVAYMNDTNKASRKALFPLIGFLGSADWAVDLQSEDGGNSNSGSSSGQTIYIDPSIWSSVTPQVIAPPGATLIWPPMPLSSTTTISFPLWTTMIEYSSLTTVTKTLTDGQTTVFPSYIFIDTYNHYNSCGSLLFLVTTTRIPVWGVSLNVSSTGGPIYLTSSVQPPPITVTVTPIIGGTTSIIGATKPTTSTGGPVIWGSQTYMRGDETETLGGRTTVVSGKTLPPTVITVTPNPHPTTTNTTPDPIINPKTPKWTSGMGNIIKPTAKSGCIGCGLPCLLFCDPECPFCPPGAFTPSGGGGGEDGDDDDTSSTTTAPTAAYTVLMETILADDAFPTGIASPDELSSLQAEAMSLLSSMAGLYSTTSTRVSTSATPTSSEAPPTHTPTADCDFWDEGWGWTFEVYNIDWWSTDGDQFLEDQEKGCGALTGWEWHAGTDTSYPYAYFNLPFSIKDGCVERAIVSAGGPKIDQAGRKRSLSARGRVRAEAVPPSYSDEQIREFKEFYSQNKTFHSYSPINWRTVSPPLTPKTTSFR